MINQDRGLLPRLWAVLGSFRCSVDSRRFGERAASMTCKIISAVAAVAGILLFSHEMALAGSMQCSSEHQTCLSGCGKIIAPTPGSHCVSDCRARQLLCVQTGCWQ